MLLAVVAATGGLLFGYDTAVISGAIGFLETHFTLNATSKGWAASCALIGCMFGAAMAGTLSDRFGRKKVMILAAVLFAVSAIGSAIPRSLTELVVARIIGGLGVGAASMVCPLYISEVSPAHIRGRLVSLNQLAIISGMLVVYFVNLLIQSLGDETWNVALGWRWMFGSETLPAMLFLGLLLLVPESPRWLAKQGQEDQAMAILSRIGGEAHGRAELAEIRTAIASESGSLSQLFDPGMRVPLAIAVVLALFTQITGINAILYYAPEIFKDAGAGNNAAFLQTVAIGALNVTLTVVAIATIDKIGRKALLLMGVSAMFIFLMLIGMSFQRETMNGTWLLVFVLGYCASFAVSLGPVYWTVLSEIFPTRIRGRAMALGALSVWVGCYLVSQTFPMLLESVGSATTFYIYAAMCVLTLIFVWFFLPETKGKTLEEIEQWWRPKTGNAR
jgi:sugar porter (SP) family MFS transporter